jgi:excisionase family DNA binding protein
MRTKPLLAAADSVNPNRPTSQGLGLYGDKPTMASRYEVSLRTIENWMRQRRLPFVKCGRVVRFNIAKCDAALSRFEVKEAK